MVKKVIFADLDGTLIETVSGETFPKGIWDMKIRYDVLEAIKRCNVEHLAVVSNQAGIAAGYVIKKNFDMKAGYLRAAFEEYLGINVDFVYCDSEDKNNENRKPNVGMLEACRKSFIAAKKFYTKEEMLMIGDASGKPGQFSDSDFKTAKNFGIDYFDVEDFVDLMEHEEDNVCDNCGYDSCYGNNANCEKYVKNRKREFRRMLGNRHLLNNYLDRRNPYVSGWFNDIWNVVVKAILKE